MRKTILISGFPNAAFSFRGPLARVQLVNNKGISKVWEMASGQYFEQTATSISALGRDELKRRIKNFRGRFKLDFTDEYLNNMSIDRLRHILLAAQINAKR